MTDIIFESFINLFQSVVVTVFLIISLGCKDKYNKKYVSAAGILITFIYLTVSNHLVFFESVGIYVLRFALIFLSPLTPLNIRSCFITFTDTISESLIISPFRV